MSYQLPYGKDFRERYVPLDFFEELMYIHIYFIYPMEL